jgi:GTP-binding protein
VAIPQVAIVGRPNVGKSSLFNWLSGRRIAIVDPTPGVTRDRITTLVKMEDGYFELIDTGGIGIQDVDNLTADVEKQIDRALEDAQLLLFIVDVRSGLTALDEEVAQRLRRITKPVLLVANKADTPELEAHAGDFYRLGFDKMVAVSAQQSRGKNALLRLIRQNLPTAGPAEAVSEPVLKLAIVGRRNTGKSTFINSLARSERMIVSEVAGTTRDSVDVRFERDGQTFVAIDTAGVRRKGSIANDIEFYSVARAERSIRRADVVLLFFDPRSRISKVDKQLAEYILEHHKPAIFVVNKWDLSEGIPTGRYGEYIRKTFPSLDFVPIAFVTAKDGKNVQMVLNLAQVLHKQASARVSTGDLNRVIRDALTRQAPPLRQNRRPKVYYVTQVGTNPPTVVVFTNGAELFDNTYRRYLIKTMRDHLPFNDVPIKLYLRNKVREEATALDETPAPATEEPASKHRADDHPERPVKTSAARKRARAKSQRREPELWDDV